MALKVGKKRKREHPEHRTPKEKKQRESKRRAK